MPKGRLARIKFVVVQTVRQWSDDNASMWAASLAFYTMLSLGPLIFVAVTLSGLWLGQSAAQEAVMKQIAATVGQQAAEAARALMEAAATKSNGIIASVLGTLTLLFGASGVFAALQDAMDAIWHVAPKPNAGLGVLLKRRFLSLAMVAGMGFLLTVSFLVTAALVALQKVLTDLVPMGDLVAIGLESGLSLGVFTVFFAAMYKVLPDASLQWRDVWLGGFVTATLFSVGKLALGIYFARAHVESAYGAAGSLALILIWVYYAAQVLFLGAEFVRVRVQATGRGVKPAAHAIAVKTVEVKDAGQSV